jgi:hypothetical protein
MKKYLFSFICLLLSIWAGAQENNPGTEASSGLRAEGKIYVVVAVVVTIFLGFTLYLIRLDRKISRLENKNK